MISAQVKSKIFKRTTLFPCYALDGHTSNSYYQIKETCNVIIETLELSGRYEVWGIPESLMTSPLRRNLKLKIKFGSLSSHHDGCSFHIPYVPENTSWTRTPVLRA